MLLNPSQILRAKRRTAVPASISAPIKGWNTRDPFEAMDPLDAVLLDNWFADVGGILTRSGSSEYATGLGSDPVQTLGPYAVGSINKLLAACGGSIYDVSSAGPVGAAIKSGFTSDIWQTVVFNSRQFWANGSDPVQIYDGTTMSDTGFTGANMDTMAGVGVFNNRLYFWDTISPEFWYGPTLGISGALSKFDLSMVSHYGGNLMSVQTLAYDGGEGIGAYTCFFLSSGETLVYGGTDPSNPNNWSLTGRYLLPPPVAQRGFARYGGDIYIMTVNDHQRFSVLLAALKVGDVPPRSKISGAAKVAVQLGSALPGWQALYYPGGTRMLFNIPNPDGTFSQHIYSTATEAWSRFRGMNAYCFGLYNNNLYYGAADGKVIQADTGMSDSGSPVLSIAQQAWQLFETPLKKRVAMVRPAVQSSGLADFVFGLGYDYQPAVIQVPDATIPIGSPLIWGVTPWGAPAVWGGDGVTDPRWRVAGGEGSAIGLALTSNTLITATWIRTDFMIEPGSGP